MERLSNDELHKLLRSHGENLGPVTDTTRPLYERMARKLTENTRKGGGESIPGSTPPSQYRRRNNGRGGEGSCKVNRQRPTHHGADVIPGIANFTSSSIHSKERHSSTHDSTMELDGTRSPSLGIRLTANAGCHGNRASEWDSPKSEGTEESLISGVFKLIGEGVKKGVEKIVSHVSDVVSPPAQRKRKTDDDTPGVSPMKRSRLFNSIDDDDDDDFQYAVPSAPPMPGPSAPPIPVSAPHDVFPSAPPIPVPSAPPKIDPPPPHVPSPVPLPPPRVHVVSSKNRIPSSPPPPRPLHNPLIIRPSSSKQKLPSSRLPPPDDAPDSAHYDWELLPTDVTICLHPDGKQWLLGKGGFGEVFKGLKDGIDEVAVKVIHIINPSSINQFKSEIDLISKLRHKHILQFYGACVKPSFLYMVTELMKTDLFSALHQRDKRYLWTGQYGKEVLMGIASGLNYLHSRRPPIVHRDIKSPNILLTDNIAKIADVGIARTKMESDMTAQRGFTIAWAAPEVVYRRRATESIDIWSFGIILWEVVTGKPPGPGQLVMPHSVKSEVKKLFSDCTKEDFNLRPSAADVMICLKTMP